MSGPVLSICIPTFERLAYLKEAVGSAQSQTLKEVEILIGDDGDSAALRAWAEASARSDSRIVYFKNQRRLGLAGNWEACAQRARGAYVTMMGDDDRLLPDFAEKLLPGASGGADVVFSNHFIIDEAGSVRPEETKSTTLRYRRDTMPRGLLADPEIWVWRNSVPMSSAIVRTEQVRRLGFKHDLNTPELELFARLASEGGSFHFVPDYLAEYRSHAGSLTTGGLKVERLVKYLEPIRVSPAVENEKRALLAAFCVTGVHRLLLAGEASAARKLSESPYYPRGAGIDRATLQRYAARAPWLAERLYRPVWRLGRALVRRRRGVE